MPTQTWDTTYETTPPGKQAASLGDNRIRDLKRDIRERMETDHRFSAVVGSEDGKHKKVTLPEGTAPSTAVDEGVIYTKDVAGQTHLFYRRESDGAEIQLTTGNAIMGVLPAGYRQGWRMSNATLDPVNDLDISKGKGRSDDDDTDIVTSATTTMQIDVIGAGGRQATDTLTNGSWWVIYMIFGTGQTTKPFAVKNGSSVVLPASYTDKALVGYVYYVDGTAGLIDFDHGDDGWVRFKLTGEIVEALDTTTKTSVFTSVTLSLPTAVTLALITAAITGASLGGGTAVHMHLRPNTYTWADGVDPIQVIALEASENAEENTWHGFIKAPGGVIQYTLEAAGAATVRAQIYTMGFYNGPFIA